MLQIKAVCVCHKGKVRTNNEDNFYFNGLILPEENNGLSNLLSADFSLKEWACFGVFDGMGGEAYGETAACIAANIIKEYVDNKKTEKNDLLSALILANQKICDEAKRRCAALMGTTAVVLGFNVQMLYLLNIGDSKAFICRNGLLRQISVDHTDQKLLALQGVTKRKPRLTQHLGIEPEEMVIEPYTAEIPMRQGDYYLLCSDGLTDMVPEDEIQAIISKEILLKDKILLLLQKALDNGGRDNITIILCFIEKTLGIKLKAWGC